MYGSIGRQAKMSSCDIGQAVEGKERRRERQTDNGSFLETPWLEALNSWGRLFPSQEEAVLNPHTMAIECLSIDSVYPSLHDLSHASPTDGSSHQPVRNHRAYAVLFAPDGASPRMAK